MIWFLENLKGEVKMPCKEKYKKRYKSVYKKGRYGKKKG